ncbi:MAG: AAA family ATPase, partial [Methylococcales bacterium]
PSIVIVGGGFGITAMIVFGLDEGRALVLTLGICLGILFVKAVGNSFGIAVGILGVITASRCYYWLAHIFFIWPRLLPKLYPKHPVAWDDLCGVSFPGLDRLLTAYAELDPRAGTREIVRLMSDYPSQRWTGLRAFTRGMIRKAAQENNLSLLAEQVAGLPEGDIKLFRWTGLIKIAVTEISQIQQRLDTQSRPFLRAPDSELLCAKIKNFQSAVSGYPEPLASEFRQAAKQWLAIADAQCQQIRKVVNKEPSPQVFRAGDPVQRNQEAFVPRLDVLGDLDRQLTLATGCPGIVLYARRRMGKSTLITNLDGFLPTTIKVVVISLQQPEAFTSIASLLSHIMQKLTVVCSSVLPEQFESNDLARFYQQLQTCEDWLKNMNQRILLAIDEYENIDRKIGEKVFHEDFLHTLRQSIQYHRHIIWLFAGSHAIEELLHAPWSSYLISARTLEIPPFSLEETRRLLTEPMKYSSLWSQDDPKRPHFSANFWGAGGIEKIHTEAGGWPHLVQLLAETAVDLSNDHEQAKLDSALLEKAIVKATTSGDAVYSALRRRLLVSETETGEWRLRVPLMQRWLRERG